MDYKVIIDGRKNRFNLAAGRRQNTFAETVIDRLRNEKLMSEIYDAYHYLDEDARQWADDVSTGISKHGLAYAQLAECEEKTRNALYEYILRYFEIKHENLMTGIDISPATSLMLKFVKTNLTDVANETFSSIASKIRKGQMSYYFDFTFEDYEFWLAELKVVAHDARRYYDEWIALEREMKLIEREVTHKMSLLERDHAEIVLPTRLHCYIFDRDECDSRKVHTEYAIVTLLYILITVATFAPEPARTKAAIAAAAASAIFALLNLLFSNVQCPSNPLWNAAQVFGYLPSNTFVPQRIPVGIDIMQMPTIKEVYQSVKLYRRKKTILQYFIFAVLYVVCLVSVNT